MSTNTDKNNRIHLYIRYKDPQGNNHIKHFCKKEWTTQKQAKAFEKTYLLEHRMIDDVTVNDLYGRYILERKMKLKSKYNFDSVHKIYIKDTIGKLRVSQVNQAVLKKWQRDLTKKGLSNRYIGKIQDLLRTIFIFGVKYEYIDHNPFMIENIQVEEQREPIRHWTIEQFEKFVQCTDSQTYHDFFSLLFWTGLRYGEAVALRVNDIDLQAGTIDVNKTWDAKNRLDTSPKTHNSYRKVVMPSEVKRAVEARLQVLQKGIAFEDDTILFGQHTHLAPNTMRQAFLRAIAKSGVPRINIHALRHSHVFMLRQAGFDAFDIAKRMGHTVDMVNETYGQWFLDSQVEMIAKMEIFQKSSQKPNNEKLEQQKKP